MILFKRVRSAFKGIDGREWALLTLETLGVVAGILIAFELSEWGARRSDAARHARMMDRLLEEIELDVSYLRNVRDALRDQLDREQEFAVALANGQCPSNKDFEATGTVIRMPALTAPMAVYEELLGAGGLSSIDRKDVRDHLAQYHDTLSWSQGQVDYFRQVRIKPIMEDDPRLQIRFDPRADDPEIITFNREALCQDQAFKNRVASSTRNHTVFFSYFQGSLEDAISACVRLGDSLQKSCSPSVGGPLTGSDADWAAKAVAAMRKDLAKT